MGCYLSKNGAHDANARLFRVFIVNDLGAELNGGKIEVTATDLVLYLKGKEPIRWPLRCLRRYGFDDELFSFESGRRCPTGSGIYAFKCRRAAELFNLVQEVIQNVGQHGHLRPSQPVPNGTSRQTSRPTSLIESREPTGTFLSSNARVAFVPSDQHLYINGSAVPDSTPNSPNYMNTGDNSRRNTQTIDNASALIDFLHEPPPSVQAPPPPAELVNYADLELPRSTEDIFEQVEGACAADSGNDTPLMFDPDLDEGLPSIDIDDVALNYSDLDVFTDNPGEISQQPNYINVGADGEIKDKAIKTVIVQRSDSVTNDMVDGIRLSLNRQRSIEQNYANVGGSPNHVALNPSPVCPPSIASPSDPGELNYIEIDVNNTNETDSTNGMATSVTSSSYSTPDSPSKRTESYAMIDFKRTVALVKPVSDDGEGLRKTRHNSTIN